VFLDLQIRPLNTDDLSAVVYVHQAAFPDAALTALGKVATRRYCEWQLLGSHGVVLLGAFLKGELVGFCFGGTFHDWMSSFLRKNWMYLGWRMLTHPWLLTNPIFRERLVRGMFMLNSPWLLINPFFRRRSVDDVPMFKQLGEPITSVAPTDIPRKNYFGILSIAVHPQYQSLGIGKTLMKEIETIANQRGFQKMRLTVHPENKQAICFYEQLGWEKLVKESVSKG